MNMKKRICIITVFLLLLLLSLGNAAAPWWACEGLSEGDRCVAGYGCGPGNKICMLHEDCRDDPETEVNECLWCESPGSNTGSTGDTLSE
jgi:hypothetical protein